MVALVAVAVGGAHRHTGCKYRDCMYMLGRCWMSGGLLAGTAQLRLLSSQTSFFTFPSVLSGSSSFLSSEPGSHSAWLLGFRAPGLDCAQLGE